MCTFWDHSGLYLGFKRNRPGIYPLGLAWHDRCEGNDYVRGLQVGLVLCSFWLARKI